MNTTSNAIFNVRIYYSVSTATSLLLPVSCRQLPVLCYGFQSSGGALYLDQCSEDRGLMWTHHHAAGLEIPSVSLTSDHTIMLVTLLLVLAAGASRGQDPHPYSHVPLSQNQCKCRGYARNMRSLIVKDTM